LSYFAFWTVRLGGWLPRFDRCSACGATFGSGPAFHGAGNPGLLCEKCRRPGMRNLDEAARRLAERYTAERPDQMAVSETKDHSAELREMSLEWIEYHTERKLNTRRLLETN